MRHTRFWKLGALILTMGVVAAACGSDEGDQGQAGTQGVLESVKSRGTLNCGVNDAVPGFGFRDEGGNFVGFDIDFCKAVAAAVLGDATKVNFVPLTAEQRFTALQGNQVDVLIRNTTWTAGRDGNEGAAFVTTSLYDGQGMMVRADSNYRRLEDMGNTTICVLSGTTTEKNLSSQFRARNVPFEPLSFEENDTLREAFVAERCEGWTSDKSQLAGVRSAFPDAQGGPEALRILDVTMSKEPLGPVVRDGDSDWYDVVNWTVIATIQAEEFGINSQNVQQIADSSTDPEVLRFLGQPEEAGKTAFDPGLGLDVDWVIDVIKAVGNYGQIYERHVGPDTPLGLPRDVNDLWTRGGLLYAPPYR